MASAARSHQSAQAAVHVPHSKERDEHDHPTLGVFRPHEIKRLLIEPAAPNWTAAQLSTLSQDTLFKRRRHNPSKKYPSIFDMSFAAAMLIVAGTR